MSTEEQDFGPLKEEIMRATYRALVKHGYNDLTVQAIADEFAKSKSLLYYHYDGKDDLFADFLEYALQRFRQDIEVEMEDPKNQLNALVDRLVPEELEEGSYQVQIALLELRCEAPHKPRVREQYTRVDQTLQEVIAGIIKRGVKQGVFADVDPAIEAELLVSLLYGARTRRLTTHDEFPIQETRDSLEMYLSRLRQNEDDEPIEQKQ